MGSRNIGSSVKRIEDPAILRGRGRFVDDIALPGMLEVAFVRSSEAHARIRGIATAAAAGLPGVVAVLTLKDLGSSRMVQANPHPLLKQNPTQSPPARDEVCYGGETVAMVVAENRYLAEDAAQLVAVDYEPLPAVIDVLEAAKPGAPRAHVDLSDQLTLYSSTQSQYLVQRFLAAYTGRPEAKIRVVAPDVGGGFGPKCAHYPEELALALAAPKLGRPLKWIEDRREHFIATTQTRDQVWDVEVATTREGKVLALRGRGVHDHGAYVPYGLLLPLGSVVNYPGPYEIKSMDMAIDVVFTNAVPTSPIRGAGRPFANFILERSMDCVARNLKLDRAEVRRRNFIRSEQMPYSTGGKLPNGNPVMFDSGDYQACLDMALQASGYAGFGERRAEARQRARLLGIGIASYNEDTGIAPHEGAHVRVFSSGKIVVTTGAGAIGQGMKTVLAQIVADELGANPAEVQVEAGDTAAF